MHCAMIQGGAGLTTYAPECRLKLERRTLPGETADQVLREFRDVVQSAGEQAELTRMFDRPPLTCDARSGIARCVRDAARTVTGSTPKDAGVSYWMDAAVFAAALRGWEADSGIAR